MHDCGVVSQRESLSILLFAGWPVNHVFLS